MYSYMGGLRNSFSGVLLCLLSSCNLGYVIQENLSSAFQENQQETFCWANCWVGWDLMGSLSSLSGKPRSVLAVDGAGRRRPKDSGQSMSHTVLQFCVAVTVFLMESA